MPFGRWPGRCGRFRLLSRGEPQRLLDIDGGVRAVTFFDGAPDPRTAPRLHWIRRMLEGQRGLVELERVWFHEFTVRLSSTNCNRSNCSMQIWHSGCGRALTSLPTPLHALERHVGDKPRGRLVRPLAGGARGSGIPGRTAVPATQGRDYDRPHPRPLSISWRGGIKLTAVEG